MNLIDAVTMDKDAARAAFLDYRRAVRARHNAEDELLMRGYRELARGHQLIDLPKTIAAAGYDDEQRPRIAVAGAEWKQVTFARISERLIFGVDETSTWHWRRRRRYRIELSGQPNAVFTRGRWTAIVPIIPPQLRPARGLDLYHVLFEAEWTRVAPRDPALIRRIAGDVFAVIVSWDLTNLERLVLGVTRRPS